MYYVAVYKTWNKPDYAKAQISISLDLSCMCVYTCKKGTLVKYFDIDFDLIVANLSVILFKYAILHFPIYFIISKRSFQIN